MRGILLAALLLTALAALTSPPDRVTLAGQVVDATTGEPVADAVVRLPALSRYALTNGSGVFVLSDVPSGRHRVDVAQLGYAHSSARLRLDGKAAVRLRLTPQPRRLARGVERARGNHGP
jgi:hypothetical protein